MIEIACNRCGEELTAPGALLFSPAGMEDLCMKMHICRDCFPHVLFVASGDDMVDPS